MSFLGVFYEFSKGFSMSFLLLRVKTNSWVAKT